MTMRERSIRLLTNLEAALAELDHPPTVELVKLQ